MTLPRNRAQRDEQAFIENSLDLGVDRRVAVKNPDSEPVPVKVIGSSGVKGLDKFIGLTVVTGLESTIISKTVPSGKTVELLDLIIACKLDGIFKLEVNGSQVLSGRTGNTSPNIKINLQSYSDVDENLDIDLKFTPRLAIIQRSLEAYLLTTEK